MLWHLSHRADKRALPMADRHYSRQKPGTPQFVKPASCLVLLTRDEKALWVTSAPFAEFVKHKWAGAWECSMFRNEGEYIASELITQAVAATLAHYGPPPPLGMITFIDPNKVRETMVRGLPAFGFCWIKAGWEYVGRAKDGQLCFQQKPERMPQPYPAHSQTDKNPLLVEMEGAA
jgi:hypothetical protein